MLTANSCPETWTCDFPKDAVQSKRSTEYVTRRVQTSTQKLLCNIGNGAGQYKVLEEILGLDGTNQSLTPRNPSIQKHPHDPISSMRSRIAASILVTLSGICDAPNGPLKGALRAVETPGS